METTLPTSERVYRAVKAELLSAAFAPGERIEAEQLARRHMTSITPVRAALHRLVGEGLVDARAGEGFHAPQVTEAGLRDLLALNGHVILLAWQLSPHQDRADEDPLIAAAVPVAQDGSLQIASVFTAIGMRCGNEYCALAISQLNDRLHSIRVLEDELIRDKDAELRDLIAKIRRSPSLDVRHAITAYHRRRIRLATDLVRLMHRRLR